MSAHSSQYGNRGYMWCINVCNLLLSVTRTHSMLIKETFHCASLRHRSCLIKDGLSAWGAIHYWRKKKSG